ncbi:hypothetical protein SUGI_0179280 [Cryptomeria japonica]|nr:hypothetical protein SUGI_0179280 [Cryptomeria japonica]
MPIGHPWSRGAVDVLESLLRRITLRRMVLRQIKDEGVFTILLMALLRAVWGVDTTLSLRQSAKGQQGLPNLPLQYWFDSCFEAIGNSLGKFFMTDEGSLNLMHTTFARLFIEVDSSKDLPSKIYVLTLKGSWLQLVDYEGIPFICIRCFRIGHTVDSCDRRRVKRPTSWWKEVTPIFYTIEKEEVNLISSRVPKAPSNGKSGGMDMALEYKGDLGSSMQAKFGGFGGVGIDSVNIVRHVDQASNEKRQELKDKSRSKTITDAHHISSQSLEGSQVDVKIAGCTHFTKAK